MGPGFALSLRRLLPAAMVLAVMAILGTAHDASAHGALKSSAPAADAHIERVPTEIRLTFNENVEQAFTRITLLGPDGRPVALTSVTVPADSPRVAFAAITGTLLPGIHTVQWQFAGRDGHPVRGNFSFTLVPGARVDPVVSGTAIPVTPDTATPHHSPTSMPDSPVAGTFDAGSPAFAAIRWFTFLAVFGIIGAVAFRYAVAGRMSRQGSAGGLAVLEPALGRAAAMGLAAATLLVVVAIIRLYAQSVAMHGFADALDLPAVTSMVTGTSWGRGWLLQMLGAFIAGAGFLAIRRARFTGWIVVAVAALIIAVSLALSGHAAASPRWPALAIAADTLHVIGAAGWLGSLFFVVFAGITSARRLSESDRAPAVAELVNAFSPTALVFASLAAMTGVFAAWLHLDHLSALWTSDYGRTLLIKLVILSLVFGTGTYNWKRVRPALGNDAGTGRIQRSAGVELVVAALVLAVTSVLVATSPPSMP